MILTAILSFCYEFAFYIDHLFVHEFSSHSSSFLLLAYFPMIVKDLIKFVLFSHSEPMWAHQCTGSVLTVHMGRWLGYGQSRGERESTRCAQHQSTPGSRTMATITVGIDTSRVYNRSSHVIIRSNEAKKNEDRQQTSFNEVKKYSCNAFLSHLFFIEKYKYLETAIGMSTSDTG